MIVDTHSHLFPEQWRSRGHMPGDMFEPDALVERQRAAGIGVTLVSDPHIWYGELDLSDIANTRAYNDFAAALRERSSGALVGLGSVNPWLGSAHLAEAVRVVRELGMPGLAIATSERGRYFDSVPQEFWDTVAELDVPVFVHPGATVVGEDPAFGYRLAEVCGRPLDTTVTLTRFILSGGMERNPTLRLLCSHAGGAICTVADRLDFGHELRDYQALGPWGDVRLPQPPSAYVRRLYLDSVTYGPGPLRLALETVGPDRLCFGSDHPPVPFPAQRSLDIVRALDLDPDEEAAVLGRTAARLFDLTEVAR